VFLIKALSRGRSMVLRAFPDCMESLGFGGLRVLNRPDSDPEVGFERRITRVNR
jgi:hypothetical protein